MIHKVNGRLKLKKRVSSRKRAQKLDILRTSVHRVLRNDLGLRPYKKRIVLLLTDTRKSKRKQFANWIRTDLKKEDTSKILFYDEKMVDKL